MYLLFRLPREKLYVEYFTITHQSLIRTSLILLVYNSPGINLLVYIKTFTYIFY